MIALDIGTQTFPLPENWQEVVSSGKYLDVVKINYTAANEPEARHQMLTALAGINGYEIGKAFGAATASKRNKLADEIGGFLAVQILEEVYPVFDFIFKPELLTDNPLPLIKHNGITYYGPGEKLAEQTGAEMEECGQAYAEYIKTGHEIWLNRLVAALYRPKGKPFNGKQTELYAKRFATLDEITKRGVLLFYEMCEAWWRETYEFLYNTAPGQPAAAAEEPAAIDSLAISRIIRTLAGGKRGTVDAVRQMPRHEIYFELAELERERREMEK